VVRKTTRNSEILKSAKETASPKMYSLLLDLVNDDRDDLAETVLKIDYLLGYASTCIKQRDINEAKEGLNKAKARIDLLKEEGIDTDYLDYLYEGIVKKLK
jgi:hypothetical protein